MKGQIQFVSLVMVAALSTAPWITRAQTTNTAILPAPRDAKWVERHEGFVAEVKQGGINVLFLGDSITDGWRKKGKAIWDERFAPLKAANFGISGDRTPYVLWRMQHGELDGIKPKAVVLMIGTNNTGPDKDSKPRNAAPEVIEGVRAVVSGRRIKLPETKVLLLAIFPRGQKGEPGRERLKEINTAIATLDDGKWVKFLDIGSKFLEPDGTLSKEIMPDLLHPNEKGYQIWADAIQETIAGMMK